MCCRGRLMNKVNRIFFSKLFHKSSKIFWDKIHNPVSFQEMWTILLVKAKWSRKEVRSWMLIELQYIISFPLFLNLILFFVYYFYINDKRCIQSFLQCLKAVVRIKIMCGSHVVHTVSQGRGWILPVDAITMRRRGIFDYSEAQLCTQSRYDQISGTRACMVCVWVSVSKAFKR